MDHKVEKISVSLTGELADLVREAVEEGGYASSSEVIRDALRTWQRSRLAYAESVQRVRELWDEGIASGFRERMPLDDFKQEARRRMTARGG
jgi:antitoxin ParD1/3/4